MEDRTWLIWSALTMLFGYALMAFASTPLLLILSFTLIFGGVLAGMLGLIRAARA